MGSTKGKKRPISQSLGLLLSPAEGSRERFYGDLTVSGGVVIQLKNPFEDQDHGSGSCIRIMDKDLG